MADFKRKGLDMIDKFKDRILDIVLDYLKDNVRKSGQEMLMQIEKRIERKIKREVKRYTLKVLSATLLLLGFLFVLYGMVAGVVYFLELPQFISPLVYGLLILVIGTIVFISND